jgi:antitoxin MazE
MYANVYLSGRKSMQVSKWGNSLAIRLPATVVETLNLKQGDEINIRVESPGNFVVEREPTREELIGRIRELSQPLPRGFRFRREDAYARARTRPR